MVSKKMVLHRYLGSTWPSPSTRSRCPPKNAVAWSSTSSPSLWSAAPARATRRSTRTVEGRNQRKCQVGMGWGCLGLVFLFFAIFALFFFWGGPCRKIRMVFCCLSKGNFRDFLFIFLNFFVVCLTTRPFTFQWLWCRGVFFCLLS